MTGFDKWTSEMLPLTIAAMIAHLPCTDCIKVCPCEKNLKCKTKPENRDWYYKLDYGVSGCVEKIREYFDKDVES